VYDMYHWDQPDSAAGSGTERPPRPVHGAERPGRRVNGTERPRRQVHGVSRPAQPGPAAAHAVQVALDRRDNGGDAGAPGGK